MSTEVDSNGRIQELEAKVAELSALVEQPKLSSRRGMLKLAAGAAAGAVAVTAVGTGNKAAAADGDPILIGATTSTTAANDNETVAVYANTTTSPTVPGIFPPGSTAPTNLFTFRDNRTGFVLGSANVSAFPAALAGYTYSTVANGIYGFTNNGGSGVVGLGGGAAIAGVNARNSHTTAGSGAGVRAQSTSGPNVQLEATASGVPTTGTWERGALLADTTGKLFYCTVGGSPGTWIDLAAPFPTFPTVPTFHALTPFRAYDSRAAQPSTGALARGGTRTISIKDKRDLTTGAVVTADLVPAGATAVTANVTVVNTVLAGFLTVNPGGDTTINAATVNWFGSNQILNNGVNLTISATREVTVIAGGSDGSSTDFVIDITGYFG